MDQSFKNSQRFNISLIQALPGPSFIEDELRSTQDLLEINVPKDATTLSDYERLRQTALFHQEENIDLKAHIATLEKVMKMMGSKLKDLKAETRLDNTFKAHAMMMKQKL
jgi:hypothetical protein